MKVFTEEHRQRISESKKGKPRPDMVGNTFRLGLPSWNKGEHYKAGIPKPWVSIKNMGNKYNYKGSPRSDRRGDAAYHVWRKEVWVRDSYKCKINNDDCVGGIIAHHILPWRDYKELRYELNNGITLCRHHHPSKWADEAKLAPSFQEMITA